MSKKISLNILSILLGTCSLFLFSCEEPSSKMELSYPDYFPDPVYSFDENELTTEGFELGRALFYDPILSIDSTISCASCHDQSHAFADHNSALSFGVENRMGLRNSPTIVNSIWQSSFMWDGGVNHIEVMPIAPITNHLEMDETLSNILLKINRHDKYLTRFKAVFGVDKVEDKQFLYALTQYMGMLISSNSLYDDYRKGDYQFNDAEARGYNLFIEHCGTCHTEPLFTNFEFVNNGLEVNGEDQGRYLITLLEEDKYRFKVPTLRNIALTHPYMHDGRFQSLEQVLNHYSDGVQPHVNLAGQLYNDGTYGIDLSEDDKVDIISFLKTLSDWEFTSDSRFSE